MPCSLAPSGCKIVRSSDRGASWEVLDTTGLVDKKIYALLSDSLGRVYIGCDAGVVRSDDTGSSWHHDTSGLEGLTPFGLCEAPDGRILAATSDGLRVSADRGATWA